MVKKYVLTGGSHSGKTSLLKPLKERGYQNVPEAALIMIKENLKSSGEMLPELDPEGFEREILKKRIELESKIDPSLGGVFIDRGIPEGIAYARYYGRQATKEYIETSQKHRYDKIFFLELLPNYTPDLEKQESPEKRLAIHNLLRETYEEFGYGLVDIPVLSLDKRVELVLKNINHQ